MFNPFFLKKNNNGKRLICHSFSGGWLAAAAGRDTCNPRDTQNHHHSTPASSRFQHPVSSDDSSGSVL